MLSIVCVYNNENILNNYLINSLNNQNSDYELILIDNTGGKFKSASQALNYGGKKANQKYIMFVHQDMNLISPNWLDNAEDILNTLNNLGVAGVAGKNKDHWLPLSNIKDGLPPQHVSPQKITIPMRVQTLDECLLIIPKKIFNMLSFDDVTCNDWHLYGVDFCLTIKKLDYEVYVLPLHAHHRSKGESMSERYFETLEKILKKHSNYRLIYTTVENWLTFVPLCIQRKFPFTQNIICTILRLFNPSDGPIYD